MIHVLLLLNVIGAFFVWPSLVSLFNAFVVGVLFAAVCEERWGR